MLSVKIIILLTYQENVSLKQSSLIVRFIMEQVMIVINARMVMNIILIKNFVKVNLILKQIKFVMKDFLILSILIKVKVQLVVQELLIIVIC